ncbi:hypothetical protein NliqN6_1944 [Naganishia liquefaciens]|uniref:histone deacetylase n=1 Tax=Naganishia liquefaciens TaxID=104408 RepID=A0A8H3YES5_9TREE|nr:hypothetical protein NliqN6_1944 [Naganishia liquefaciens]
MAAEDVNMNEPGPSRRAQDATSSTSNGFPSGPPAFVLPPDPSSYRAKNANFSYVTAEPRLPPREIEAFPPSKKTGVIYDAQMMLHAPLNYNPDLDWEESQLDDSEANHLAWHPEDPRRIQRIYDQLQGQGLTRQMVPLPCPTVSVSDVLLVHSEALWHKVEKTQFETREEILAQTDSYEYNSLYVNQHTARSASLSCGGVVSATKAVVMGKVKNALAIVRPPGHHAEPECCMGFSFYNNVAVATRVVQKELGVRKVLILDWDVHHGNGTQKAFFDDPSVLYMSIHRHDGGSFYPQSDFGAIEVTGSGDGEGTSVNIPWPKRGFGDADYLYAFQKIIMPIAYEFAPELVIISAGFDAADGDTLGQCKVTPAGYAHMTYMLSSLAGGKVVVALEGGYNLTAISNSAEAVARVLLGQQVPELPPMQASDIATEVMYQVAKVQSKYWSSIDVQACMPVDELTANPDQHEVIYIPDLIKLHRAHHLYKKYGMTCLPLALQELQSKFPEQVMNTGNTYSAKTLVLFVHDFGNMFTEGRTKLHHHPDLEKTGILKTSDRVVEWAKSKGYSLIDVNVLRALPTHRSEVMVKFNKSNNQEEIAPILGYSAKHHPDGLVSETKLLKYIWDNYIQLTDAQNVIFIGHGTGCQALMCLINDRDVEDQVKFVIQVAGMNTLVKPDPRDEDKILWFRQHSMLYLPHDHPLMDEKGMDKRLKTTVVSYPDTKTTDIMNKAFPAFTRDIARALGESLVEEPTNDSSQTGAANGIGGAFSALTQRIGTTVTDAAAAVASAVLSDNR